MCVMPICPDMKRAKDHMRYEHGIVFGIKYAVVSCFIDTKARESIEDTLTKNHNLEINDDAEEVDDTNIPKLHSYNIASIISNSLKTGRGSGLLKSVKKRKSSD